MRPSARPLRPILPKPADVVQGSLRNVNPPVQSSDGVLSFSLTLAPEDFPNLREPAVSTNDIRTTGSSTNSRGHDLDRACYTWPANGSFRCRFCQGIWPSKPSLLAHLRKHSQDASRETDLLLEKLVSRLSTLGYEIDVASATACGQDRSNVTLRQAQDRQRPGTQPSSRMPVQTVQQTPMTSSGNNVDAPPGTPSSSLEQRNDPPALPFSLKPVRDLDALEEVVKQEKGAVLISCNLEVAEEGRKDRLGKEDTDEPPSAHRVADPASGGDLVINESPDPASGADLVTNESPRHLSKQHIPNNSELPPSTPSAVHAKGVQRKRRIYGDHVANDAKATRRLEHFHENSLDRAESSPAPSSITEFDYGPATSRPKRIRSATRHPPQYDLSDNGAPSQNAPKGAVCQKSAQAPPSAEADEEIPTSPSCGGTTKTWQCPSCFKVLSCKSNLNRHRQLVHEGFRPLKCPHCAKSFGLRDSLRSHIRRVHTGERPFGCHLCPSRFFHSSGLQRHLKWHNNVRMFACDLCPSEFVLKEHLKRHVRTHTRQRSFACPHCPSAFFENADLQRHLMSHNNVRRYACDLCPGKFILKEHLKRHVRTHSKERSFACPHCPRRLSTLQTLKRHLLTHVDDWPHQCEVCDKRFRELRTLRNHARSRHPTKISLD